MKRMKLKFLFALVWSFSLCGVLLQPAYARPVATELEVEESASPVDEPVCQSEESILNGLLADIPEEQLESVFQSNSPEFASAFNSCVDGGGDTAVCEEEAMQVALLDDQPQTEQPQPKKEPAKTPQQIKDELRKAMREHVFLMVNLYWMEHDMKVYGYWDQDGDGIADRLDRDSYNGHGVGKGYPRPIPGARADGHYNCEYFAQYFRQAFVAVFYERSQRNQCWKLEYQMHATIAFYYYYKGHDIYVFMEPQGGSAWFINTPTLPLNQMPGRGQNGVVNGIICYNTDKNAWTGVMRPDPKFPPLPGGIMDKLEGKGPIDMIPPIRQDILDKLPLPADKIKELKDLLEKAKNSRKDA
jgi:hypothetical protein